MLRPATSISAICGRLHRSVPEYMLNSGADLVPGFPDSHAVMHLRRGELYMVTEVRQMLDR